MARKAPPSPTHAVIYLRVSTEGQADSGLGLEAQLSACQAHAARMGWTVAGVHTDAGISGRESIDGRPGLAAAAQAVRAPGHVLLVYSVSRVSRSQRHLLELVDERGEWALPLVSASEPFDVSTPAGRAMLGMISVFAQLEADMCSERTRGALAAARARGVRLGAPGMAAIAAGPGGEGVGRALARIAELRRGGMTMRAIVDTLNAEGVASARGGIWHLKTVQSALKQIKGMAESHAEEVRDG